MVLLSGLGKVALTLGSVLAGALLAFWFQNIRENRIKRNDRLEAIIRTQHSLYFMWSILAAIRYTYLDERRDDPKRHRMLRIYWLPDYRIPIDFNSITFLHQPSFRALLTNIFMAERCFLSAIDAVLERNRRLEEFVPKPGTEHQFDPVTKVLVTPLDQVKDSLLKSATDALYNSIDNGMGSLEHTFSQLRECAKTMFPDASGFMRESNLTRDGYFAARGQKPPDQATNPTSPS